MWNGLKLFLEEKSIIIGVRIDYFRSKTQLFWQHHPVRFFMNLGYLFWMSTINSMVVIDNSGRRGRASTHGN